MLVLTTSDSSDGGYFDQVPFGPSGEAHAGISGAPSLVSTRVGCGCHRPGGRKRIAQRFIAGKTSSATKESRRDERRHAAHYPSVAPDGAVGVGRSFYPPLKRWAIVARPVGTLLEAQAPPCPEDDISFVAAENGHSMLDKGTGHGIMVGGCRERGRESRQGHPTFSSSARRESSGRQPLQEGLFYQGS